MGYTREYLTRPQMKKRPWKVHPIWRGIGCILIILVPILSYIGAVMLVEMNMAESWVPSPAVFMQTVTMPVFNVPVPHLYANLVVAGVLILVGYAGLMVLYAIIYSIVGPSQLGPLDAEPLRRPPRQNYKFHR
jgi:hypothetical protein